MARKLLVFSAFRPRRALRNDAGIPAVGSPAPSSRSGRDNRTLSARWQRSERSRGCLWTCANLCALPPQLI